MIYFNNWTNLLFMYYYINPKTYYYDMILATNLHMSLVSFYNCWIYPKQFSIYYLNFIIRSPYIKIYDIILHQIPSIYMLLSNRPKNVFNAINSFEYYMFYFITLHSFKINFKNLYKINENLIFLSYLASLDIVKIRNYIIIKKIEK